MNLSRLLRTTAIRLSLRYALFYAILTGLGLGVLYWATSGYVDAQIAAGLEHELSVLHEIDKKEGRDKLLEILSRKPIADRENRRYFLLVARSGERLAGSLKGWPSSLSSDGKVRNIWIEDDLIPTPVEDKDGYWPMVAAILPDGSRLLIAQSVRQAENLREFILSAMSVLLAASVGLTLVLGFRMGGKMLQRIDRINGTARMIQLGDLSRRVPLTGRGDEFDELAVRLNEMLRHIEKLVIGMQEVTDNVAHDLRRPLSRLRNRLEVTLLEARDEQAYRLTMEHAVSDVDGMIRTFNALLEIAQAEAGSYRGEWEEIDLSGLARDVAELYAGAAEENHQSLQILIEPDISIKGNRHLVGQAISNLLENAVKYAGSGNLITLSLSLSRGCPLLTLSDNGPGIPAAQYQHVLKRFVRLDTARSTIGNGLGLSLVAAVARLHGAKLELKDNHPGLHIELLFTKEKQDYWERRP